MKIKFPPESVFDFDRKAVAFPYLSNGRKRRALVSTQALQDHFGARREPMTSGQHFVDVFEANRRRIEELAERILQQGPFDDLLLRTEFFHSSVEAG